MNLSRFKRSLLLSFGSPGFPALFVSRFLRLYIYICIYYFEIWRFPETGTGDTRFADTSWNFSWIVDGCRSVEFEARRGILFENVRETWIRKEENAKLCTFEWNDPLALGWTARLKLQSPRKWDWWWNNRVRMVEEAKLVQLENKSQLRGDKFGSRGWRRVNRGPANLIAR